MLDKKLSKEEKQNQPLALDMLRAFHNHNKRLFIANILLVIALIISIIL